ncbi:MAG: TonB-dependent receptor [Hyphomonadaceae bacterium]
MRWMKFALAFAALAAASPAWGQAIVVTGERRAQETSTLAGNAAALTSDDLAEISPQVASEALNRLPGVAIHRNNGIENLPAIRSPVLVGNQSAGSFLVLEDGVPIRAPGFANVNQLFETSLDFAERVEVVRGPGSVLYGSNAVHGIVNVITLTPGVTPEERSTLDASYGSFGRASLTATTNWGTREGAVDNNQLAFLGVSLAHDDGWRAASSLDQQQMLLGFDSYLGAWNLETRVFAQNVNQESAGFIQGPRAYDSGVLARSNPAPEAYRDARLVRARATLWREWGAHRLTLTPYGRWIEGDLNLFFFPSRAQELTEQTGGGLQASYYWDPNENFTLILGGDADRTQGSLWEFQTLPDQPNGYLQGLHYDYDVTMDVAALYAQANWQFAEDWRLVAGLRGEYVRYDYENNAPVGDFGRFRRPADRTDAFDAITPKIGIVWTPGEETFWLNLARGARPPQITDLYSLQTTQTPGEQDAETIDSIELGWRGDWGPATFEIALYHMDKRDTSFRNADGFTVTDGETRHQGIEIGAILPITENFELSGWITYAQHTYRFDDPVARAGESISSGDDVDSAPRWIWNARAAWRPFESVRTELEWVHMGEYYTNAANTARYTGHDVLNLRADWDANEHLTVFAAIRNLTNTDYADRADFAFGNDRYFPGEDRGFTIGIRARR